MKVRKAVIPAAGLGTRMLPATKTVPKEMLAMVDKPVVQYIIEEKETGRPVGSVYFRDVDPKNHSAEYGIFIGEADARGKGYGTETARLFTEFGFAKLGLHRISLRLLAENLSARRSYEKAGFVQEGIFHDMVLLDGRYRDIVFMAKLAQE